MIGLALGFVAAVMAAGQAAPANVQKLAAEASVDVAIAASTGAGGRYLVLGPGSSAVELAPFAGRPDLSCYSRAEAVKLDRSVRTSDTIHGRIAPRWSTTVICGFVDETNAVCWQYSPAARAFVKVGEWIT